MKYQVILAITLLFALSLAFASNLKRKHIVIDRSTTGAELTHVVRRNPTISSTHTYGLPTQSGTSNSVSFGSNNDDNGGNSGFGKSAAIANPSIYFHSPGSISVIKETPAHVGYRHESNYVTSVNKASGKVEQHVINRTIPITGLIQEVKSIKTDITRRFDLTNNQFGPISTSMSH